MGLINNQNGLREFFPQWAHRDDFTNPQERIFIENATMRLQNDLRVKFMESSTVLLESATPGSYLMPGDYSEMQAVHKADGSWLPLIPARQWALLKDSGSNSYGYTIRSAAELVDAPPPEGGDPQDTAPRTTQTSELMLLLRPASGEDLTLHYMTSPQLIIGNSDSNPVLIGLQNLYLRATLLEVHLFVQDWEQFDRVKKDYDVLVAAANKRYSDAKMAPGSAVSYGRVGMRCAGPVRSM